MTPLLEARGLALAGRLESSDVCSKGGELIGIFGPNGSGKTSLLRALARVEGAGGLVRIDGVDVDGVRGAQRSKKLAFLPAGREMIWPIKVADVIALGLDQSAPGKIATLMTDFELEEMADRPASSLSTGERSRVLLARALAAAPRLILLDEPLSHLDPYWVVRTLEILARYVREGSTVALSMHDLSLAPRCDRLIIMRGGKIIGSDGPSRLSAQMHALFGVERDPDLGWRISSPEGQRSLP